MFFNIASSENADLLRRADCKNSLPLDKFIAVALSNNIEIAEIDRDYADGLAKAFEIEVFSNPEISMERVYTGMELNGDSDPQTNIAIGQPIKLADFGTKSKVADLIRKSQDLEKKSKLLEFSLKLTLQYYKLYALQETRKIISEAENLSAKKVKLIQAGVKKGLFSIGEEKLFEGEQFRLQAEKKGIEASIFSLQQDLGRSLNLQCLVVAEDFKGLEALPSVEVLYHKAQQSDFSELNRIELLDNLNIESKKLAKFDAYQLTPRFVYQHTNDGGDFYGAGITVPLPIWNRNQGEQMRADAEHQLLEQKKLLLQDKQLNLQIEYYRKAAENYRERSEIFSLKVVPAFEAAFVSQEKLYSEGKGNILQVWQTLRVLTEAQIHNLILMENVINSRSELSILIGENL